MESFNTLVLSLPTRNSTLRMRLWRALKETGCGVLRDGVYVLPAGAGRRDVLERLGSEIRSHGGFAITLDVTTRSSADDEHIRELFNRADEYAELLQKICVTKESLPALGARRAQTEVRRLERALQKLAEIDFYAGDT